VKRLLVVVSVLALAATAAADWDPGQPSKWVQYPDLEPTGIDVNTSLPYYLLADDFLCTTTGPITDIHIWGSWYQDLLPEGGDPYGVNFTLSIHADIPADESPTGYSMPGDVLWTWTFTGPAGEFVAREWALDIDEGWMEPPDYYEFPGDHVCWQYNFFVPEDAAFYQEGTPENPIVYWLDVQAEPLDGTSWFGWKTSLDHWNDDAVWGVGSEPYYGPWYDLHYPPGHPYSPESIDLAFVITTTVEDEYDWGDAPDPPYPTLVASTGASHLIVPGVYMGASVDPEPDGQPDPSATGDDLDGNDDEDGVAFPNPFVPGGVTNVDITTSVGGFIDAWFDWNLDGSWTGEQVLASYAVPGGTVSVPINVPAGAAPGSTVFARFRFSTVGGLSEYGLAPDGEVEDYNVQVTEEQTWKWRQLPDLTETGIDVNSTLPYICADDWLCDEPGRVDEIRVWGSWLNDYWPFLDPSRVRFTLSIHADIPAEPPDIYSTPGDVLWIRDFQPGEFSVAVYADQIVEGWLDPPDGYLFPADYTCWEYVFYIPDDEAFHQVGMPDDPVVYWLDVQAEPQDADAFFGWKTSLQHWNDDAVWGSGTEPYFGPWFELRYPAGHQLEGQSIDLAFQIICNYGTGADQTVPKSVGLEQNTPNPFNPKTTIAFDVPAGGCRVAVDIVDVSGRVVRHLLDDFENEGRREVTWDGRDDDGRALPSGVYFYRMVTPQQELTRKMLLLK
jgi:hypothetical protein